MSKIYRLWTGACVLTLLFAFGISAANQAVIYIAVCKHSSHNSNRPKPKGEEGFGWRGPNRQSKADAERDAENHNKANSGHQAIAQKF